MNSKYLGVLLTCITLACGACKETKSPSGSSSGPLDACTLITRAEIEATQGSPVKETKSSATTGGGFRVSQCFYTTSEFSKSVSIAVTQRDPSNPSDHNPREYWEKMFDPKYEKEHDKEEKGEREEENVAPPQKIDGVGDGARWTGMRFGGALYVLKGEAFIRISVGGGNDEESKINKSKTLAAQAVGRL